MHTLRYSTQSYKPATVLQDEDRPAKLDMPSLNQLVCSLCAACVQLVCSLCAAHVQVHRWQMHAGMVPMQMAAATGKKPTSCCLTQPGYFRRSVS